MELKVIVPTSLSEITLEQYQRFARLEGDDEFSHQEDVGDILRCAIGETTQHPI
jgi:hypothetical protein